MRALGSVTVSVGRVRVRAPKDTGRATLQEGETHLRPPSLSNKYCLSACRVPYSVPGTRTQPQPRHCGSRRVTVEGTRVCAHAWQRPTSFCGRTGDGEPGGARGRQSIRQSQEDARRSVRQRPFIRCLSHPRATMSSALSATTSSIPSEEGVGISGMCHQPAGLSRILPASFARLCGHDLTVSAKQGKEKGLLGEPRTPPPPAL